MITLFLKIGKTINKVIVFAKRARGAMVRYIIDSDAQNLEDIKGFNLEGYQFSQEHTVKTQPTFFIR